MENQIASNYKDASCVAIWWRKQERFRYTRERYFEMKFWTPFQSENKEMLLDDGPRLVEDLYTVFGVCIATWLLKF